MPRKLTPAPKPIQLNEEQQAVVAARYGVWQCLAGPGSGKSACLVERYAALIREGAFPDDILSLSFTATAAKNLRDRVEQQVGKLSVIRKGAGACTLHSLGLVFATEERDEFPFDLAEFPLATEPVANKLSGNAGRRYDVDPRVLRQWISLQTRRRVSPNQALRDAEHSGHGVEIKRALAYKDYWKALQTEGQLDFDCLIYWMVELLETKPEVRARWVRSWIQVDEAQDLAKIEWDLIKLLFDKSLLAVGDVSQGLYSFRGGDARLFADMHEMFPQTRRLLLATNYRSTPEVIDFIRPFAATPDLAEKFHTPNKPGPTPTIVGFQNAYQEAEWVVKQIQEGM